MQARPVLAGSAVVFSVETGGLSVVAHPTAIQPRTRAEATDRRREEYFMVREERRQWLRRDGPPSRERADRAVRAQIPGEAHRDDGKDWDRGGRPHLASAGRDVDPDLPSLLALSHSGWRLSIRRGVHFQPKLAGAHPGLALWEGKAEEPDLIR